MKHWILSTLLLHSLRSKYVSQHILLERPHFPSSEISDSQTYNVGPYGCLISQYHPILYEVSLISLPPSLFEVFHVSVQTFPLCGVPYLSIKVSFTKRLTAQFKPLLYEMSHISVCMSCFISQYQPSFRGFSYLSVTLSSIRCLAFQHQSLVFDISVQNSPLWDALV